MQIWRYRFQKEFSLHPRIYFVLFLKARKNLSHSSHKSKTHEILIEVKRIGNEENERMNTCWRTKKNTAKSELVLK